MDWKHLFEIGDFSNSIDKIDVELSNNANLEEVDTLLKYKYISLVQLEEIGVARQVYLELSEKLRNADEDVIYWCANILISEDNYDDAFREFSKLEASDIQSVSYLELYIYTCINLKKYEEGISICDLLKDEGIQVSTIFDYRSYMCLKLGRYEDAIMDLGEIIKLNQATEDTYNNIGYCYEKLCSEHLAMKYFKKALYLNSSHIYALNNLGYLLCKNNDIKKGYQMISKSINLNGENSYAYKNLGKYYLLVGNSVKAKEALLKAHKMGYTEDYDDEVDKLLDSFVS